MGNSLVQSHAVTEALEKLRWHLASINTLSGVMSDLGFKQQIRSDITETGRVLLCIAN